jgi:hypothetical protein
MSLRPVKEVIHTRSTVEGAGVKLGRAFGFGKEAWKPRRDSASPQQGESHEQEY